MTWGDPADDEAPLSVDGSLAMIETERDRVARLARFNPTIMSGIWAVAWFVGFGCAFLAYGPGRVIPSWLGPTVPAVLLAAALVASIGYAARVDSGITGPSRTSAAMYGWSWTLSFTCLAAVNVTLGRHLAPATVTLLWSASSLLLVGVLDLAGGALFRDRVLYVTGVWTMVCATAAVMAGVPANFLVQALAGGGGFAAMAVYTGWVRPAMAGRRR
jgi:hypothetical protein